MLHLFPETFFRSAIIAGACAALAACTSHGAKTEYGAYGYLSPGPGSEPEFIGVFPTLEECEAAAEEWTTRQVVGNPIHAECFPADQH